MATKHIKIKHNKKIVSLIFIGIIFIITMVSFVLLYIANKELNTYDFKEAKMYIYFSEEKFDFLGNLKINHDNKVTSIKMDGEKVDLYSEPIYYADKKRLFFPVNYSIVTPLDMGKQYKVSYFSELLTEDEDYYLKQGEENIKVNNSFFFDGEDYYIFINEGDVFFNDQAIHITPYSYVNYIYSKKKLYIYNYEEDKVYYYENVLDDVRFVAKEFEVNLSSDSLLLNGKNKLLMKNFSYLKKMK